MKRLLALGILLFVGAACSKSEPAAHVADLRLTQEGEQFPVLSGVLVNTSERPLSSAEIMVELLDANNMAIDDAVVRIQLRDITAGDSAFFRRPLDLYPAGARVRTVFVN